MYIVIISIISSLMYIILRTKKNLHILQQNFYNENNRYIKWGNKNIKKVFKLDFIILIISILNLSLKNNLLSLINIFFILLMFLEYKKELQEQVKIPIKITSRINRLFITSTILYLLPLILYLFNIWLIL